jgi:hypothetical protein
MLMVCAGGMLLSAIVIGFSVHDRLHAFSLRGWVFEAVAGTHAYNEVSLYGATFVFLACLLCSLFVVLAGAREWLSGRAGARRG